jgi:hypothetical protein
MNTPKYNELSIDEQVEYTKKMVSEIKQKLTGLSYSQIEQIINLVLNDIRDTPILL